MPTITFEPPATVKQYGDAVRFFALPGWFQCEPSCGCARLSDPSIPCDLTLDPTKPESWARAVYEAGVHHGYCKARGCRVSKSVSLGGVTQQPNDTVHPAFDTKVRCKVCGETDELNAMETPLNDGYVVSFVHKKCNSPSEVKPPRTASIIFNGVEYRPVTSS